MRQLQNSTSTQKNNLIFDISFLQLSGRHFWVCVYFPYFRPLYCQFPYFGPGPVTSSFVSSFYPISCCSLPFSGFSILVSTCSSYLSASPPFSLCIPSEVVLVPFSSFLSFPPGCSFSCLHVPHVSASALLQDKVVPLLTDNCTT